MFMLDDFYLDWIPFNGSNIHKSIWQSIMFSQRTILNCYLLKTTVRTPDFFSRLSKNRIAKLFNEIDHYL